jgi:threonylcarbamoyladenosine tRNA methylthiotransferase MtaB
MNRPYRAPDFSRLVKRIHKEMPFAAIGVDTLAGFPGEDQPAYRNTAALIRDLPISYLHVFPYSARKGTAAAGFSDFVPERVIKERTAELRELGKQKRRAFHESCMGKTFAVLVEGWQSEGKGTVKGLSENYLRVAFHATRLTVNELISVKIESIGEDLLFGRATH